MSITYSTVEKRSSAPGWQANNDLWQVSFNEDGTLIKRRKLSIPIVAGCMVGGELPSLGRWMELVWRMHARMKLGWLILKNNLLFLSWK